MPRMWGLSTLEFRGRAYPKPRKYVTLFSGVQCRVYGSGFRV